MSLVAAPIRPRGITRRALDGAARPGSWAVAGYGSGEVTLDVDVAVVGDVEDDWGDVLPLVNSTLGWYSLLTASPPS
jgi:hypothetical protein